jgi:hypothetical protein
MALVSLTTLSVMQTVEFIMIFQWPRGLRHGSPAVRVLGLRVRIPPEAWMSVSCDCCVLSGRGLCDGPITPEYSDRVYVRACHRV